MTEKTPTGTGPQDAVETRLQALEELCAHQASEIENLSDQVREQWDKIDQITKAMLRLRDRVMEVEEAGPSGPGGHENTRPPHY
ncbi:MAG: SlyX family protein [Pseudomonadota bacterium]